MVAAPVLLLARFKAAGISALDEHEAAIDAAAANGDRFASRRAVRRWASAGRKLFEATRSEAA